MKKLFGMLALVLTGSLALPACSGTDSLDEVVKTSNAEVSLNTDDEKPKIPKPGGN